jgi:hypothetical protein
MNSPAPWYLLSNVLSGCVAVIATVAFGWHRALRLTEPKPADRRRVLWSGLAMLLTWFFAALALSWAGFYQGALTRIPTIQFGLLIPIVAGVVLFRKWPPLRRAVEAAPQSWIAGIQVYRVEGLIFLMLYAGGWLPGAFAWPAGVGDMLVGLLAPVVGIAYMRGVRGSAASLRAWNRLGITDLVVAVTTGFLTSPSPVQLLSLDRPNELITAFPLAMIPVFLVPLAVLLHLASWQKLHQTENTARVASPLLAGAANQ